MPRMDRMKSVLVYYFIFLLGSSCIEMWKICLLARVVGQNESNESDIELMERLSQDILKAF